MHIEQKNKHACNGCIDCSVVYQAWKVSPKSFAKSRRKDSKCDPLTYLWLLFAEKKYTQYKVKRSSETNKKDNDRKACQFLVDGISRFAAAETKQKQYHDFFENNETLLSTKLKRQKTIRE